MTKLTIIKRDNKLIQLNITKDSEVLDITGYTVFFTVKTELALSDDDASIKKDVTSHTDPTQGKTQISLVPSDTSDLDAGKYYYDIQIKDTENKIMSTSVGEFYITQDVTERTS